METEGDQSQGFDSAEASEAVQDYSSQGGNAQAADQEQQAGNPFWREIEQAVGPQFYQTIKPHLDKSDAEYGRKISETNKALAPWKSFVDEGLDPDTLRQAMTITQQLNQNPLQAYNSLGTYLRQQGLISEEAQQQLDELGEEEEVDPQAQELDGLRGDVRGMQEFIIRQAQMAQRAQESREADAWLEGELGKLGNRSVEERKQIIKMAAYNSNTSGKEPDIAAAAAEFDQWQQRLRNAPRPQENAPRVPGGVGGGTPSATSAPAGEQTKEQRIAQALSFLGAQN